MHKSKNYHTLQVGALLPGRTPRFSSLVFTQSFLHQVEVQDLVQLVNIYKDSYRSHDLLWFELA